MYLCSFVLDEPANAYVGLSIVNLLVGTITLLIVYMFDTVVRNDVSRRNSFYTLLYQTSNSDSI